MGRRAILAVGLLATAMAVLATEPRTVPRPDARDAGRRQVSTTQAQEAAAKALQRGRVLARRGELQDAREQFEIARQLAPSDSEIGQQALEQLQYQLPLRMVHEHIKAGNLAAAETMLERLLAANQQDVARRQQIDTMLRNLQLLRSTPGLAAGSVDTSDVLRDTRRALEAFRRQHGRYPVNSRELNRALPPNEPPLEAFLIGHYHGTGAGYVLLLRSKADPNHTLTLQNTGLLR